MKYVDESPLYNRSEWGDTHVCTESTGIHLVSDEKRIEHEAFFWRLLASEDSVSGVEFLDLEHESSAPKRFKELVRQWKEETWFLSSLRKRVSHNAHLKIIGYGAVAISWILEELEREPDYWFPALEAITQADPAPHAENMTELREAWLEWGRDRGYIA